MEFFLKSSPERFISLSKELETRLETLSPERKLSVA